VTDARQLIAAYWAAAEARDWDAFGTLLATDVVYEGPQDRVRVRGRAAYLRFNAEGFPGDWHLAVERIAAEERSAASWIQFTDQGETYPGRCFFDIDDAGQIARITDFWPAPYEVPASRAHLVERY
jgi:ketosteroid isomerase-like protein